MLRRLKCLFGKHEIETVHDFEDGFSRIGCPVCKKEWVKTPRMIIPYNLEIQQILLSHYGFLKHPHWYKE